MVLVVGVVIIVGRGVIFFLVACIDLFDDDVIVDDVIIMEEEDEEDEDAIFDVDAADDVVEVDVETKIFIDAIKKRIRANRHRKCNTLLRWFDFLVTIVL